ncbi:FtsX-like permease family protein [Anaerosacchariphilus polymeriproducens]|uniref:ABC transporter permease n=1 Tax=Anaerosacchariphilus polymeriproducens TaxID=1812858 RepID=A0A371AZK9_9FIRM|nr:FtsX-like permease family protein [Anaerosacchariphilus polymeriproducens]RDU24932.1 ABC transporter permease [Anaerosacchariphilus polymeriproducens]
MQKILFKRLWREFKSNLFRYFSLAFLIIMGMYLVISLVGAAETVITGVDKKAEENRLEDGEFQVFEPLTETEELKLHKTGISLEKMFSLDFKQEDGSTIRVFNNRKKVNLIDLDKGRLAQRNDEVVLEKRYCEEHNLTIGDRITIGANALHIVGVGSVPDYDAAYKNLSDSSVESKQFGLAFVSDSAYNLFKAAGMSIKSEEYVYAYHLNGKMTDEELKEKIKAIQFIKASDNPRIKASAEDQVINKIAGLIAGIIILILFTYVISVFVIHGIEKESSVIGSLYALGVKKKDLLLHYIMLPVTITFLSGIIGTMIGYSKWGIDYQMVNCYNYFSVPKLQKVYFVYLLLYGILLPPVVAAIVNCIVIRKKLSRPALELIKNEKKNRNISNVNLGNMGFIGRFRIRQMLREARTGFTVLFGMFIALLIMMLGINCYVMCKHISKDNKKDTKYEYMYTYKYPQDKVPDGGEACFAKTLKKEILGYNHNITLLGINEKNPYFEVKTFKQKNLVVISSAMAQKYHLSIGDSLILSDEEEDIDYAFRVKDIVQYSAGFYAFMDIETMRELLGENDRYYNVILSDKKLDISPERLYATTSKQEISKASDVFVSMMMPMIYLMTTVSAFIFCVVMYLMMKVMIERSAFSISLIKIFGYRSKEIRKLFLNGNFYLIAVGAAICIPLSKKLMDIMYPILVSNVACAMNLTFSWKLYLAIYLVVIALFFIINFMLTSKINKIVPSELLKNRE